MIDQATINGWRKNLLRPLKWEVELERVGYTEKQAQAMVEKARKAVENFDKQEKK